MSTPYERLLAEEIPTGTFGYPPPPTDGPRPWTALEQAEHLAVLEAETADWRDTSDRATRNRARHHQPQHLRLITTDQADTTAA